jgi:trans-L-3-hydroxyproline dehydratase
MGPVRIRLNKMAAPTYWQTTEDWHTAGEPFRIVSDVPAGYLTKGLTVAQQRLAILETPSHPLDTLRRTLCHEPRGHADMYGGFIVPPDDSDAHFGVLFWHKNGFSTACGHGTIALGYWAVANGIARLSH